MCRECVGEALQLGTVLPRTCAHDARHYFTVPCTRACGCGRACPLQWRGCTCTDACGPRCPCVEAMRECDPDVCSGMHRAAVQGGDPRQHCGNMAFQCCDFRRTVVGLSTTEGAGFGLFAAEACRCNDLILPYSGELVCRSPRPVLHVSLLTCRLLRVCAFGGLSADVKGADGRACGPGTVQLVVVLFP